MNGDGARPVHSFFTSSVKDHTTSAVDSQDGEAVDLDPTHASAEGDLDHSKATKTKRTRKANVTAQQTARSKTQKTLKELLNSSVATPSAEHETDPKPEHGGLTSADLVLNDSRKKRRRTSQHESVEVGVPDEASMHSAVSRPASPQVVLPTSPPKSEAPPAVAREPATPPPKKMLRLTGNGKFSSPVHRNDDTTEYEPPQEKGKRRGRSRKAKAQEGAKQLLVRLHIGDGIRERVTRIIQGEERVFEIKKSPKKKRTPRKPAKSTHPFFLDKPKNESPVVKPESPRKTTATTPGKLRSQVFGDRLTAVKEVPYNVGSALLKDRLLTRQPGAREAPWPDREQAHVQGLTTSESKPASLERASLSRSKRKHARHDLSHQDSVLTHFRSQLVAEPDTRVRADGYNEPNGSLRVPEKLLLSGHDLRERLRPSLSALKDHTMAHPAILKLWSDLAQTLNASDVGSGESLSWTQKYAPGAAEEVLQPGVEMKVLKDWLFSLTVNAVETATKTESKSVLKAEPKPRKKRRRKPADLDDFLVDSDEDIHNMDVLDESADVDLPSKAHAQRSVVQMTSSNAKLSNAVLLSGPHGCGKTAAAYAVAKELGFKVFDISPCERRSGKDVLEKVGDMTENHMVKHHGIDPGESSSTEEPNKTIMEEAFQRDLESGRQGKMSTFFQPKLKAVKKPVGPSRKPQKATLLATVEKAIKKPGKDQQQSLILLEEVDILFKDDKEFWNTVLRLIVTSKRPFIMTCNDEDLVPLQAMNLHAILRFTRPAAALAADYMLLVAASEGHLLHRPAVASLYHNKHCDLRASLTELNFWCQVGVGDPKSGLSWIYQRWPPGSDLDEAGRKLRVVSEGTYHPGMGLLPDAVLGEEEQTMCTWHESGITPMESVAYDYGLTFNDAHTDLEDGETHRGMDILKHYARLTDAMSAIDVFVRPGLPETASYQTTQPPMPDKLRSHYIEGLPLLQVNEQNDDLDTSANLAVGCTLAARRAYLGANAPSRCGSDMDHLGSSIGSTRDSACHEPRMNRKDFAVFDPISIPSETASSSSSATGLLQSAFDGPLSVITTDLAPYVRTIVQYDLDLEEQRERLSQVLTEGRAAKKARTTRAARSALEGSQRSDTRRERWFSKALDLPAVLATGGETWPKVSAMVGGDDGSEPPPSSAETA